MRILLALAALLLTISLAKPVSAEGGPPVELTGTVGELGAVYSMTNGGNYVRFKMHDPAATKSCDKSAAGPGYAWIAVGTPLSREWFEMLMQAHNRLAVTITLNSASICQVTSITFK
jgi:hypothetical protein